MSPVLLLLQLPPMPGRNYMYTGDYVDEISRDKVVPQGEQPGSRQWLAHV
jgi:hypothetical protein